MIRTALRIVAVLALVVCVSLAIACRSNKTGCKAGEPYCHCPCGASCTQSCSGKGCGLHCANDNGVCTLKGSDESNVACQGASECHVEAGANSMVACQYVKTSCSASVGAGSQVHCEGAALCEIACTGACDVDCPGGQCRVHCADPATCNVQCGRGATSPSELCANPAIKVCGRSCS